MARSRSEREKTMHKKVFDSSERRTFRIFFSLPQLISAHRREWWSLRVHIRSEQFCCAFFRSLSGVSWSSARNRSVRLLEKILSIERDVNVIWINFNCVFPANHGNSLWAVCCETRGVLNILVVCFRGVDRRPKTRHKVKCEMCCGWAKRNKRILFTVKNKRRVFRKQEESKHKLRLIECVYADNTTCAVGPAEFSRSCVLSEWERDGKISHLVKRIRRTIKTREAAEITTSKAQPTRSKTRLAWYLAF